MVLQHQLLHLRQTLRGFDAQDNNVDSTWAVMFSMHCHSHYSSLVGVGFSFKCFGPGGYCAELCGSCARVGATVQHDEAVGPSEATAAGNDET